MSGTELRVYREKLLALAARLKRGVTGMAREALQPAGGEGSGGLSNAPLHLADLGTAAFEKEMSVSLLENQTRMLDEIEEAVHRIDSGEYGVCRQCGTEINRERLQAVLFTPYCINCARELEKDQANLPLPPTGP